MTKFPCLRLLTAAAYGLPYGLAGRLQRGSAARLGAMGRGRLDGPLAIAPPGRPPFLLARSSSSSVGAGNIGGRAGSPGEGPQG